MFIIIIRLEKTSVIRFNLNLSYVKNKITNLKGTDGPDPDNGKYWFKEGYAIGSFYGYVADWFLQY